MTTTNLDAAPIYAVSTPIHPDDLPAPLRKVAEDYAAAYATARKAEDDYDQAERDLAAAPDADLQATYEALVAGGVDPGDVAESLAVRAKRDAHRRRWAARRAANVASQRLLVGMRQHRGAIATDRAARIAKAWQKYQAALLVANQAAAQLAVESAWIGVVRDLDRNTPPIELNTQPVSGIAPTAGAKAIAEAGLALANEEPTTLVTMVGKNGVELQVSRDLAPDFAVTKAVRYSDPADAVTTGGAKAALAAYQAAR